MKQKLALVVLVGLVLAFLGCRARSQAPAQPTQPAAQVPAQPVSSTAPTVTITWPPNGARVRIGQPFTVHATANDSSGIARVGYSIDGQASEPIDGSAQPIFSASFSVTVQTKGVHTISVAAANRAGTKSAPAVIRVVGVTALSDAPAADDPPTPVPQLPSSANPPPAQQPPSNQPAPPPPPSGASVNFFATPTNIQAGECTTVRWDADGVREIYFEGAGVTGHEERRLCDLSSNTTFVLHVIFQDGSARDYTATVTVTGGQPGDSNQGGGAGQGQQGSAPAAPTNCRVSEVTAHHVLMQWDYSGNAGGFNIYITRTQRVAAAGGQARVASVDNLNAGTRYRIDVRAFNAFGESPIGSCAVDVTTAQDGGGDDAFRVTGVTASVEPTTYNGPCPKEFQYSSVITTNRAGTVNYHWESSDGFTWDRSHALNAGDNRLAGIRWNVVQSQTGTAWIVIDAPNRITSNRATFTATCAEGGGGAAAQRPPSPTNCRATVTGAGQVRLNWEFPQFLQVEQAPQGFRVYQGVSSRERDNLAPSARSAILNGLASGVQYHFDVRAFNAAGESAADACGVDITAQ
jgi:hypothetical protein